MMDTVSHENQTAPQAPPATKTGPAKVRQLFVSEKAILEIEKLLAKRVFEGKKPAQGLRVGIRGGGCTGFGYLFEWCEDAPRATDRVFEFKDGAVKVFCDPKSLVYLDGTTLDFVTSIMGHGFKFVNPNTKGTCGCGESVQF